MASQIIINAHTNTGWYSKGQHRLMNSLIDVDWKDILFFDNPFINEIYNPECRYTVKASALKQAVEEDYQQILWVDCSMIADKHPQPIFEKIEQDGFYCETNGYYASQECNDKSLLYFGISRDEAESIPMISSGMMGLNMNTDLGREFYYGFIKASLQGIFNGSREHNNQSMDSRFLHHRQDQSVASLLLYKLGYKPTPLGHYLNYTTPNDNTIFVCKGM